MPGAPPAFTIAMSHDEIEGESVNQKSGMRKFSDAQIEQRMDEAETSGHVSYRYPVTARSRPTSDVKIFGLVAVRNVGLNIGEFLRLLSPLTDAIAVLDDASTDNTVEQVLAVAQECQVEVLITKNAWLRNEAQDKNLLLRVARRLGASAFIVPDYDEIFSAACYDRLYLRDLISRADPGARIDVPWIEYWGDLEHHRVDPLQPDVNFLQRAIPIIFVDYPDRVTYVPEKDIPLKIHYPRIPMTGGSIVKSPSRQCVIVEFRFVSLVNVYLKRIWYACFGALHGKTNMALGHMNQLLDETPMIADASPRWLSSDSRRFAETFQRIELWRARQICQWLIAYGKKPFEAIPMWTIDWDALSARFMPHADDADVVLTADDFAGINSTESRFMAQVDPRRQSAGAVRKPVELGHE
jgi:glycosyltransferase involved in cell wall biosynthesis